MDKHVRNQNTYSYSGPVYRFNKLYSSFWAGETQASSPKQALNNLTYKAKKDFDFTVSSNLTLDPDYLSCDYEQMYLDVPVDEKIKHCPNCGERLTDGGYCPRCDDGYEDVYANDDSLDESIEKHDMLNIALFGGENLKLNC